MKKLLVLLLIFVLSFTMFACGNNDETPDDQEQNPVAGEQDGEEGEQGSEEGETDEPGKLNPDELIMGDGAASSEDELMGEYDFGFKVDSDFAMASTIKKVDYSDISAHAATMEKMLSEGIQKVFGGGYDVFADYEAEDIDTIDELAYAVGMENSDSEASYLEAGVYHDTAYNKHFQYTVYTSENAYKFDSEGIKTALREMKDAYGITISQKTAETAVKEVLDRVGKTQDYYSLYQEKEVSGSGYVEMITVSVDGFCNEDGSLGYYFALERERCYE